MGKKLLTRIGAMVLACVAGFGVIGGIAGCGKTEKYYSVEEVSQVINSALDKLSDEQDSEYSEIVNAMPASKIQDDIKALKIGEKKDSYFSQMPVAEEGTFNEIEGSIIDIDENHTLMVKHVPVVILKLAKNLIQSDIDVFDKVVKFEIRDQEDIMPSSFDLKLKISGFDSMIMLQYLIADTDGNIYTNSTICLHFDENFEVTNFIYSENGSIGLIYVIYNLATDKSYVLNKENSNYESYKTEITQFISAFNNEKFVVATPEETVLCVQAWKNSRS